MSVSLAMEDASRSVKTPQAPLFVAVKPATHPMAGFVRILTSVLHLVEDASISAPIHKDRLAVPAALGLASTAIVGHAMVTIIADKIIIAIPIIIIMV